MKNVVVTTGWRFTDIDSFACAIAYTELLMLENFNAEAVLPGSLNNSITKSIINWKPKYQSKPTLKKPEYILVDISDPKYFAKFVDSNSIVELFDHRYGFQEYWKVKLGKKSHIEIIGSCATLIWEEFTNRNMEDKISVTSARLLYTAIVSNTLYFKASVTTDRDQKAAEILFKKSKLTSNWVKNYFEDQNRSSFENPVETIMNDTKEIDGYTVGQLELWNSKNFINTYQKEIKKTLLSFENKNWFFTAPSINEGINYIYTEIDNTKKILENKLKIKFLGNISITKKLLLRKEIMKIILNL